MPTWSRSGRRATGRWRPQDTYTRSRVTVVWPSPCFSSRCHRSVFMLLGYTPKRRGAFCYQKSHPFRELTMYKPETLSSYRCSLLYRIPCVENVPRDLGVRSNQSRRPGRWNVEEMHRLRAKELPDGRPEDLCGAMQAPKPKPHFRSP